MPPDFPEMSIPINPPTPPIKRRRVDVHCHCLPGVDDGPASMDEALSLCRLLVADGFTDVIATPHQLGRWDGSNLAAEVRRAVPSLQAALDAKRIPLKIHAGAEVRVDERIPRLLADDQILTLADAGKHLLIELPMAAYIGPDGLISHLSQTGLNIILAHPERYAALQRDHAAAFAWVEQGVAIQINADALLAGAGAAAQSAAWDWMQRGWVSLVASDAHGARIRPPRMAEAMELITRKLGDVIARRVCVENPLRILAGEPVTRVMACEF